MTRRIVRTITQVATATVFTLLVLFFLDRNFRVLPNAIHEYLPTHHAGLVITDITAVQCSSINPFSNCELDPETWHKIDKNLYLGKAMFGSAYVYVRSKREEELVPGDKVVMDITVGRMDPSTATNSNKGSSNVHTGHKEEDGDWESRPLGIWVRRSAKKHASDDKSAVTAVDVLFGDDAVEARDGWEIRGTPLLLAGSGSKNPAAQITIRRGAPKEPFKPIPRINDNGKFKILQLADLHLSTGTGNCRDALPQDWNGQKCEADPRTLDFVTRVMEDEKPDLVVLSGDQVNGDTAPDAQSAIFKYAQLLIKHKIPYVTIFGNHDDEGSMPRSAQMALVESLSYSLSKTGPEDINGVGNYYIEVLASGSSTHSAITVYLLDTHAYSPNEKKFPGYDWIKPNQIDWFKETSQGLRKKNKEYTHHHMNVAFIHIPLPEYRVPENLWVGNWKEAPTAPVFNSGFRDALVEQGVVMVSCGHDHVNEYCMLSQEEDSAEVPEADKKAPVPKLWMCYAGGAGFGGYAGYGGFHRKVRVFDFDMNQARITTWKREEFGELNKKLDEQVIVDAGHPVAPVEE